MKPGRRARAKEGALPDQPTLLIYSRDAAEYAALVRALGYPGAILPCSHPEEGLRHAPRAEIMLVWRAPAALFRAAPGLRWVQSLGAGVEDLVRADIPDGIPVTRVVDLFGPYIAEYIFGHLLHRTLDIPRVRAQQAARRWEPFRIGLLRGRRIGVAGLGSIGRELVRKARAFDMEVWGLSRSGAPVEGVARVFRPEERLEFVAGLDVLASVLPRTPATDRLFGAAEFAAMKPGALVVNCGRGAVLDEAALVDALRSGHLGGAILDVFATEPLPPDSPLWGLPNVTVTPHISGPSVPAEVAAFFMENFRRHRAGEPLAGVVDRCRGY